jgi:hypothetical protein
MSEWHTFLTVLSTEPRCAEGKCDRPKGCHVFAEVAQRLSNNMALLYAGEFKDAQPEIPTVKGVTLQGGPQMIQLRCAFASCQSAAASRGALPTKPEPLCASGLVWCASIHDHTSKLTLSLSPVQSGWQASVCHQQVISLLIPCTR